jgi:hypothetical protein
MIAVTVRAGKPPAARGLRLSSSQNDGRACSRDPLSSMHQTSHIAHRQTTDTVPCQPWQQIRTTPFDCTSTKRCSPPLDRPARSPVVDRPGPTLLSAAPMASSEAPGGPGDNAQTKEACLNDDRRSNLGQLCLAHPIHCCCDCGCGCSALLCLSHPLLRSWLGLTWSGLTWPAWPGVSPSGLGGLFFSSSH